MRSSKRQNTGMSAGPRGKSNRRRCVLAEALERRQLLTGTITGTVFNDQNNNQVQDAGEAGIPNIEVYEDLRDAGQFNAGDPSAVTNASGVYTINGALAGSYVIRQLVPKTAIQTLPVNYTQPTEVVDNQTTTVNFGQYVLNPNTSLDALSSLSGASATATEADGKVIVVGQDIGGGYPNDSFLARYFPDGTIDKTFGTGAGTLFKNIGGQYSTLTAVSIQPNGEVVVAGEYFDSTNSADVVEGYIEEFSVTGQQIALREFTPATNDALASGSICTSVIPFGSGQAIIGGTTPAGGIFLEEISLATVLPVTTFGSGGLVFLNEPDPASGPVSLALSPADGSIWAATTILSDGSFGNAVFAVAHFDASGDSLIPNGFTEEGISGVDAFANGISVQSNGKPVLAGYATSTPEDFALMRFNTDGTLDTSFGGDSADNLSGSSGIEVQQFTNAIDSPSDPMDNAQAQTIQIEADGSFLVTGVASDNGALSTITSTYPSSGSLLAQQQQQTTPTFRVANLRSSLPTNVYFQQLEEPQEFYHLDAGGPNAEILAQPGGPASEVARLSQPLPSFPNAGPAAAAPNDPGITAALTPASLPTLTAGSTVSYTFSVLYQDSVYGIDPTTLTFGNLNVSGTSLANAPAVFTGLSNFTSTSATATYSISLPSNQVWSSVDNGAYTLSLNADQVASRSGATITTSENLGGFNVSEAITTTGIITGLVTSSGSPAAGVTVYLLTQTQAATGITTTTNSSGGYLFTGVVSGFYNVAETVPAGFTGGAVGSALVKVGAGAVAGPTFANVPATAGGSIVGSVFISGTNDPLPDITVFLDTNNDGTLEGGETSVLTNAAGSYTFPGLSAGTYNVAIVVPTGDTSVTQGAASVTVATSAVSGPTFVLTGNTGSISGAVKNATANGPLSGVTVTLTNSSAGVLSTTSDSNGNYSFAGLPAGTYTVAQVTPSYATGAVIGSAIVTVGTTAATGPVFSDTLIGGVVLGTVFNDLNGDGYQESSEPGIAGVMIYDDESNHGSYLAGDPMTTTDANGNFILADLPLGAALIRQVLVTSAYKQSIPALGGAAHLTIGSTPVTADFGQTTNIYVSGEVFFDANGNRVKDTNEGAASDVIVYADENGDGTLDSTDPTATPDANGIFSFTDLPAGTYTFRISYPSTDQQSTPTGGAGITVTLANSSTVGTGVDTGLLFGVAPAAGTITGTVISPQTGVPLPGVTVFIDANGNGQLDPGEVSAVTDSHGQYVFTALPASTYTIAQVVPASTINTYTGSTQVVLGSTLGAVGPTFTDESAPGEIAGSVINGLTDQAESGVVVYLDTNNNGTLDTGETEVVTDATGSYQFSDLLPGTYHVAAINPGTDVISGAAAVTVANSPIAGPTLLELPASSATGADLAVSVVSTTPASVIGGTLGSVTILLTNHGTAAAIGRKAAYTIFLSPTAGLSAGDTVAYSVQRPLVLQAGRSGKLRFAFKYPTTLANGSYYLVVSVNGTSYFSETSYTDNTAVTPNPIQIAQPVITLSGTVVNPALTSIAVNREGFLYINVVNSGNVLAYGVMTVGLYADVSPALDSNKISLGTVREVVILKPGKSHTYRLLIKAPLSIAAGAYYLIADLNQKGNIDDSDPAAEVVISPTTTMLG